MIRKRQDKNQTAIVKALKQIGCYVIKLSDVGAGCPDLLIGYKYTSILIEVKNKENWYGKKEAHYETQKQFRLKWRGGLILTATSPEQIIDELQKQFIMIDEAIKKLETTLNKQRIAK